MQDATAKISLLTAFRWLCARRRDIGTRKNR